jgi:hypothetical protein
VRGRNRVALATIVRGFRLAPHVYHTVPLGHGRRCLAHNGHQRGALDMLAGLAASYVIIRVLWRLAWGSGG